MSGRKQYKPGWTIAQRSDLIDNKQAVATDRSDRWKIDNFNLCLFWSIETARSGFIKKIEQIRRNLDIDILDPENDIPRRTDGRQSSTLAPKRLFMGINSQYLDQHPKTQERLTEAIYSNVLIPLDWSFNFYSFVEYYVLYNLMHYEHLEPNPFQLELMLERQYETFRNRYTKSDIAFLRQRARSYESNPRKLNVFNATLLAITVFKNKQRSSKYPMEKLAAFLVFEKTKDKRFDTSYISECAYDIADRIKGEENSMVTKKEHRKIYHRARDYYKDYKKNLKRYKEIFDN